MTEVTSQPQFEHHQRIVGRIIKVHKKGWGFISSIEIQFTRIFFHWTALRKDSVPFLKLETGMIAEFTPVEVPDKGWRAVHVKVSPRAPREESVDDFQPAPIDVSALQERQPDADREAEG